MSGIVDKNEVLDSNMDTKKDSDEYVKKVEQSLRKTFKKRIWSKFTKAINTYELVKPGDKIAVCISGGKDSMVMAKCFQELKTLPLCLSRLQRTME